MVVVVLQGWRLVRKNFLPNVETLGEFHKTLDSLPVLGENEFVAITRSVTMSKKQELDKLKSGWPFTVRQKRQAKSKRQQRKQHRKAGGKK